MSLPVRGAWIEIYILQDFSRQRRSRSPCGERGLKFLAYSSAFSGEVSLPVRGAWIEIEPTARRSNPALRRSPCGERGLK